MKARNWASRRRRPVTLAVLVLTAFVLIFPAGCGLQTDEANKDLAEANKHRAEAEAILARFKAFPADWEAIFNVPRVTQSEIDRARQLVQAREQDVTSLENSLTQWGKDLDLIAKLNVETKIKEYVNLKKNAIKGWQDYVESFLTPLIKAYSGMVEIIAYGRPASEQEAKLQEITNLASESAQKLEEIRNLEKQADDYFTQNKLGK
jgi:hypothetical protein